MPKPGMLWRHVIISTKGSWLPGDPRGFRSKDHDIHSSGDYKSPPPKGEHAGLHRYAKKISPKAIVIPKDLRETVGRAIIAELKEQGYSILAISVAATHAHFLAELPADRAETKTIVGRCKTAACYDIREQMPGTVWARDGKYLPTRDQKHQRNVFHYIEEQEDAWIWTFQKEDGWYND